MADGDRTAMVSRDEEIAAGGENRVTGLLGAVEQAEKKIAISDRTKTPRAVQQALHGHPFSIIRNEPEIILVYMVGDFCTGCQVFLQIPGSIAL
jgi:hypothetical protein